MKSTHIYSIALPFLFLFSSYGYQNPVPPDKVLKKASKMIQEHRTIHYDYRSEWDNRFNETTFSFGANIIHTKIDSSVQGFGFYAKIQEDEYVFDGFDLKEIQHSEKTIVTSDPEEIKADPDFFSSMMIFLASPMELLETIEYHRVQDTVLEDKSFYIYQTEEVSNSVIDEEKKVKNIRNYYLEYPANTLRKIKQITIIESDTAQIIDHYFTGYRFEKAQFDFDNIDLSSTYSYRELTEADLDNEADSKQITEGSTIPNRSFVDLDGNEVSLYGDPESQSLIMFSFIGCAGCEYAMKEMKKENFQIKKGVNLYYSSPLDKQSTLKKYLIKKEFPFKGFSKESNMNDDFSVYSFPTFVLIDSEGTVTKVLQGYSEEVANILF